jgi:REP element-mobilizing transposase RayT
MSGQPIYHCWYHTQIWLKGHWLHGDPRGFRDAGHRVHSGGDYKHRPPVGEHAGLHRYHQQRLKQLPFVLSIHHRANALALWRKWLDKRDYPLAAFSVNGAHTHLLAKLPSDDPVAALGWGKKYVSQELSKADPVVPASLFAARGEPKLVKDAEHLGRARKYVLEHELEGAAVWGVGEGDLDALWRGRKV